MAECTSESILKMVTGKMFFFILCTCILIKYLMFLYQELFILFLLLGQPLQKRPKSPSFKSVLDDIWQNCSSNKYTVIDRVGFLI